MHRGWHQVAFERELRETPHGLRVGNARLMLLAVHGRWRAFDAVCPHRGADLARGVCEDAHVVCPFHGRRIGLGEPGEDGFAAREYTAAVVGGLAFVLLDDRHELGFVEYLRGLERDYDFTPGFTLEVACGPETVVENAFDQRHFQHVHGLSATPELRRSTGENGEIIVEAHFRTERANPWQSTPAAAGGSGAGHSPGAPLGFRAHVFSPGVCVTELRSDRELVVITGATPLAAGGALVRVSVGVAKAGDGSAGSGSRPDPDPVALALLSDSKLSIEQDKAVWDHLTPDHRSAFARGDEHMIAFHEFCQRFV